MRNTESHCTTGTDVDKILPAMSRFGGSNRLQKNKPLFYETIHFTGFETYG
jgi:hypothetical protein